MCSIQFYIWYEKINHQVVFIRYLFIIILADKDIIYKYLSTQGNRAFSCGLKTLTRDLIETELHGVLSLSIDKNIFLFFIQEPGDISN